MIQSTSLADRVFDHLEEGIYNGSYPPGSSLTELGISKELGVSRTPVREALRRLEQEQLIRETGRGSIVLGLSPEDVADIYEIRLRTEGLAARWAARRITPEQLRSLQEITELQSFYLSRGDTDKLKAADTEFHTLLYAACGSPVLQGILTGLHRKIQAFRRRSLSEGSRAAEALEEHQALYRALADGDAEEAERLAVCHVRAARDHVMTKLEEK
ncbi:MAG: GntR family transcriptional regulator [Oscillospiraceae bacterium]